MGRLFACVLAYLLTCAVGLLCLCSSAVTLKDWNWLKMAETLQHGDLQTSSFGTA